MSRHYKIIKNRRGTELIIDEGKYISVGFKGNDVTIRVNGTVLAFDSWDDFVGAVDTFTTRMYEKGARVKEIAANIGDLESTTEKYYIAVRKKIKDGGTTNRVVMLPAALNHKK